jgi:hypothetical protein
LRQGGGSPFSRCGACTAIWLTVKADSLAEDLRLQMDVNRFHNVEIKAVSSRNEIIVQVPDLNSDLEKTLESFMDSYQSGIILE